jgi:hypothetical protein
MRLMRYVENASPIDGTTAIVVGDDRPTIQLGGAGEMTDHEISNALAMGHVLEEVDDGGLSKMTVKELDARATKLGLETSEDDSKADKVSALRERLASGPEDPAEVAVGGTPAAAVGGTGTGASGGPTGTSTGGAASTTGGTTT